MSSNTSKSLITLGEIDRISEHSLNALFFVDLLNLDEDYSNTIMHNLRKMYITSLFGERTIICIAGVQGAGKTTMIRNFYNLDEKFLPATHDIGEKIPVIITESNVKQPCMKAIRVTKDEKNHYFKEELTVKPEEYINLTKGTNADIMYIELIVPYKHTLSESVSFMLLPGFEFDNNKDLHWEDLIDFSVNSADSAICVFDDQIMATVHGEKAVSKINEIFGENLIYALSRSDGKPDKNEGLKTNVVETLQLTQCDRVVCVGSYLNQQDNLKWISDLQNSIEKYAIHPKSTNKNAEFLYASIKELRKAFTDIKKSLSNNALTKQINIDTTKNEWLSEFDNELEEKREILQQQLKTEFSQARTKSKNIITDEFAKPGIKKFFKGIGRQLFGPTVKDLYIETQKRINLALRISDKSTVPSIPDEHLIKALEGTIEIWTNPALDVPTNTSLLLETTASKENPKKLIFEEKGRTQLLVKDVCNVLAEHNASESLSQINAGSSGILMRSIVEMSTYYMTVKMHDCLANKIGNQYYPLVYSELKADQIVASAEECKKLAVGLAGVAGIDILEGNGLDFAGKIAKAFEIPTPAAAAIVAGIIAVGFTVAVIKDMNKMVCSDCLAAHKAIDTIYDKLQDEALNLFNESMKMIKCRIVNYLNYLNGKGKNDIYLTNAVIELNNADVLLTSVMKKTSEAKNRLVMLN